MNNEINERVRKYRNFAGLSQEYMAKKLGLKPSTYSQMERNGNISAERIAQIAAILGISPTTLLYSDEAPEIDTGDTYSENPTTMIFHQEVPLLDENGAFKFPEYEPTKREIDFLKTIKSLPKSAQQEVLDFVQKKLSEN